MRATGGGHYATEIMSGWDVAGNANGGYLLSVAVRALREAAERPDPVTVTGHYLSPGRPGPASITTEVVKRGRTFTTVAGSLDAAGKRLLQVLGTFGDVSKPMGPERVEAAPPDLPPPDDCVAVEPTETFPPPFMGRVELRLHPDDAGFASGAPSGELRVVDGFGFAMASRSTPSASCSPSMRSHPRPSTLASPSPGRPPSS